MALKAWLADLVVQHAMEGRATTDVARSALFAAFGASYQGVGQYLMINVLLERRLFPGRALRDVLAKVAATNLLMDPLVFFPCFYTMREVMTGGGRGEGGVGGMRARLAAPVETVTAALAKYRTNMLVDWRNSWLVWVPAHCVTYGLCPVHLRISWMASVSFSYVMLLSFTRGDIAQDKQGKAGEGEGEGEGVGEGEGRGEGVGEGGAGEEGRGNWGTVRAGAGGRV
jgi:protein Mpv17